MRDPWPVTRVPPLMQVAHVPIAVRGQRLFRAANNAGLSVFPALGGGWDAAELCWTDGAHWRVVRLRERLSTEEVLELSHELATAHQGGTDG